MMALEAIAKGQKAPAIVRAADKFGRFKSENPLPLRSFDLSEDRKLYELLSAWKATPFDGLNQTTERNFLHYYGAAMKMEYSACDIERLSVALACFQGEPDFSPRAGYYLSALIFNGKEQDYVVHTAGLPMPSCLCSLNNKNVVIDGNGGRYLGDKMVGGSITVSGDAEEYCGMLMEGGSIIVRGEALDFCGNRLKGGMISIGGNAGRRCGEHMKGGEIHVRGSVGGKFGWGALKGKVRVDGDITGLPEIAKEWNGRECRLYHGEELVAGGR